MASSNRLCQAHGPRHTRPWCGTMGIIFTCLGRSDEQKSARAIFYTFFAVADHVSDLRVYWDLLIEASAMLRRLLICLRGAFIVVFNVFKLQKTLVHSQVLFGGALRTCRKARIGSCFSSGMGAANFIATRWLHESHPGVPNPPFLMMRMPNNNEQTNVAILANGQCWLRQPITSASTTMHTWQMIRELPWQCEFSPVRVQAASLSACHCLWQQH